jgi:cysteinyl-tRNA synthetase
MWNKRDLELFANVNSYKDQCVKSLLDDLDGTRFLNALMAIVDLGSTYIRDNKGMNDNCPEDPLRVAIETTRGQLKLVGFTEKTFNAGLKHAVDDVRSSVIGGEYALIEELASFRSQVRVSAIQHLRSGDSASTYVDPKGLAKQLLKACDDSRSRLAHVGVELFDGGTGGAWKLIPPKQK